MTDKTKDGNEPDKPERITKNFNPKKPKIDEEIKKKIRESELVTESMRSKVKARQKQTNKKTKTKRKYRIPVTFTMYGVVEVEAESVEEALRIARDDHMDILLPDEKHYLDASWDANDNEEMVQLFLHEDYGQTCANCGHSVKKGSGNFVDRIPIATEYEERKEIYKYPDGEFICRECAQTESDNNF